MERQPIRDKHQAAIDAVFADASVPNSAREPVNALLTDAEDIESERDEAIDDADEKAAEIKRDRDALEDALVTVRYWLIDVLSVKPRNPRKLLRTVEKAL